MKPFACFFALFALLGLCAHAQGADWYVSPKGAARGAGTKADPMDLSAALVEEKIAPGDTVWLFAGEYKGPFLKTRAPAGTKDKPLVYRAMPGERVVLTRDVTLAQPVLKTFADHTWFWGLEFTTFGTGQPARADLINTAGGDGLKLINLAIHDGAEANGIGGWNSGDDQEIYGCLMFRNGLDKKSQSHGIYTQNLKKLKTLRDCVIFNNFGWGVHCYGQEKSPQNYLFDGVTAYGNGLPEGSAGACVNFLVGGYGKADNITLRGCNTYYPTDSRSKRGADMGYTSPSNGSLTIEKSVFHGGGQGALWIRNWTNVTFRDNTLLSWQGAALMMQPAPGADTSKWSVEGNEYYTLVPGRGGAFNFRGKPYETIAQWREATGFDAKGDVRTGPPAAAKLIYQPNAYEPDRANLIIYNWPKTPGVEVDLSQLPVFKPGDQYTVLNVEDLWGKPVAQGTYEGKAFSLPMAGAYAPEFGAYVVLRKAKP